VVFARTVRVQTRQSRLFSIGEFQRTCCEAPHSLSSQQSGSSATAAHGNRST
jgi:hypothetical protein